MSLLAIPGKLEKLKIKGFSDVKRSMPAPSGEFSAFFNPENYSIRHAIRWGRYESIGPSGSSKTYQYTPPSVLNFKLILDGTGSQAIALTPFLVLGSVQEQIDQFRDVAFKAQSNTHEPNYLVVSWGGLSFKCRLSHYTVTYTNFDRDGTPFRAELDISLLADEESERQKRASNTNSPDLTHRRTVKAGDTLPLLSKEIYGSSSHYLWLAEVNGLNHFRRLLPGTEVRFPPLPVAEAQADSAENP